MTTFDLCGSFTVQVLTGDGCERIPFEQLRLMATDGQLSGSFTVPVEYAGISEPWDRIPHQGSVHAIQFVAALFCPSTSASVNQ